MNSSRLLSLLAVSTIWLYSTFSLANTDNLILNGASSYRDLGNDKFVAALYLELPSNNYDNIISTTTKKRMEMRLTSSYSKRRWVNLWMQSIAISNSSNAFNKLAEPLVEMFNQQKGGLEPGDIVSLEMADNKSSYRVNGVTLAEELPGDLFNLFINTWIGMAPPSADFRDAVLGVDINTAALEVQLAEITPAESRVAAISEWIVPPEPEIDEAQLLAEQKAAEEAAALEAAKAKEEEAQKLAAAAAEEKARAEQERLKKKQEEAFSVASALALKDYINSTKIEIYKFVKYPSRALRLGQQGRVRLTVEVDRDGNLVNVEAASASPHESLDKAAIKAVKKAAPYQPIPDAIKDQMLSLSIPISFTLVD